MYEICVLANEFPYGTWEPYMETEEIYYTALDKIWIASLQLRKDHAKTKRMLKSKAEVIPVKYKSRVFYLLNSFTVLLDKELYREISELKKSDRLNMSRIVDLFVFLSRAHHEARVIDRALRGEDKQQLLLYSYRFEYQPYVALLLNRKWKKACRIISRAHRYDIYEEEHRNGYIPLRKTILNSIDYVFPCSEHGVEYIRTNYGKVRAKIECKYLGTIDHGVHHTRLEMKPFKIVSCSNVVKVKRLEKIVNALSLINNIEIQWTHFGDGPLLNDLKKMISQKVGENVEVILMGNVPNDKLLDAYFYNDYHIFINVSASEGLPVSIMEAMSFGIPCIATDVGGTRELVNNENGFLIDANASDEQIADLLCMILEMNPDAYQVLRERARKSWNCSFNANRNYFEFIELLKSNIHSDLK